ncbi:hypothetical protein [Photobacterium angustum]|uniref:hypothetical protein n=1 Tax=Photobacterium angustum TaxID=661 RepID=UPI0005DBB283|nr:hypothetical protein [Photobacterium angustum]KJG00120.1 hypothetical protein UB35_19925 [Photobacterium angustum]PSV61681.1 hypothetical protein CTM95_20480 [Photobacterium angustum]
MNDKTITTPADLFPRPSKRADKYSSASGFLEGPHSRLKFAEIAGVICLFDNPDSCVYDPNHTMKAVLQYAAQGCWAAIAYYAMTDHCPPFVAACVPRAAFAWDMNEKNTYNGTGFPKSGYMAEEVEPFTDKIKRRVEPLLTDREREELEKADALKVVVDFFTCSGKERAKEFEWLQAKAKEYSVRGWAVDRPHAPTVLRLGISYNPRHLLEDDHGMSTEDAIAISELHMSQKHAEALELFIECEHKMEMAKEAEEQAEADRQRKLANIEKEKAKLNAKLEKLSANQ